MTSDSAGHMLLLLLLFLTGCGRQESPEVQPGAGADQVHVAVANLLEEPGIGTATTLLALNGVSTSELESVPDETVDSGLAGADTLISAPSRVSAGTDVFVLLPARLQLAVPGPRDDQEPLRDPGETTQVFSKTLFVFTDEGRLIRQLGGSASADGLYGDNVVVTSLATPQDWFAIVTRQAQRAEYAYVSDVYLIRDSIPRALAFLHSERMAFSAFAALGSNDNYRISFLETQQGKGTDGKTHPCSFQWNPTTGRFQGPAMLTASSGKKVFEVNLSESMNFKANDMN